VYGAPTENRDRKIDRCRRRVAPPLPSPQFGVTRIWETTYTVAVKWSEIALKRQRGTYSKLGSTNRPVWTTTLYDASFPILGGYPIFEAMLNAYSCKMERDSSKESTEHLLDTGIDMSICASEYRLRCVVPRSLGLPQIGATLSSS
jgi:hypothetical protein